MQSYEGFICVMEVMEKETHSLFFLQRFIFEWGGNIWLPPEWQFQQRKAVVKVLIRCIWPSMNKFGSPGVSFASLLGLSWVYLGSVLGHSCVSVGSLLGLSSVSLGFLLGLSWNWFKLSFLFKSFLDLNHFLISMLFEYVFKCI